MNTVTILRQLARLRIAVAIIVVLSLGIGLEVCYKVSPPFSLQSRKYDVGVANARLLVDTPASQVVEVDPKGSDILGGRATLLANLMVDGDIKSAIARKAGLSPGQLVGSAAGDATPTGDPAVKPDPRGFKLSTKVLTTGTGESLPIIEIDSQGPDVAGAERLANAAVTGLQEILNARAAQTRVPDSQRLHVSSFGPAQGHLAVRGPRLVYGLLATVLSCLLGCAALLAFTGILRGLREPALEDEDEPLVDDWDGYDEVPVWDYGTNGSAGSGTVKLGFVADDPAQHPNGSPPVIRAPSAADGSWDDDAAAG
jgi:hypothetical protein